MARILFTTFGSYGDLYPYLAVGSELHRSGHEVCIATSASFREKVEEAGLSFAPVRPDLSLTDRQIIEHFFDQRRGSERVIKAMVAHVRESYEDTLPVARSSDVIITHLITFASVLAAQKLRSPWISSVLAPASFLSAHDPPIPAPLPVLAKLRIFGPGVMRLIWNTGLKACLPWVEPVLALRRELGLGPTDHPLFGGSHSPGLVLALFSRLFATRQPDWPPQALVTGFPFYDTSSDLAPELRAFLDAGPEPVVFTLGSSAVSAAGDFYTASLRAIDRLQTRAVLLTGSQPQGLPERLPPHVFAWPYAPHEQVFRRAAAIVHQGGVGTTAQAMRAGKPMLVVPFSHDQFDNAERARRLHVATVLPRGRYSERAAVKAIRPLLRESSYAEAAHGVGAAIRAEDGAAVAAEQIAEYVRKGNSNGQ